MKVDASGRTASQVVRALFLYSHSVLAMMFEETPQSRASIPQSERAEELTRFYEAHAAWVRHMARGLGGDGPDVEDLIAELWMRVAENLSWWAQEPEVARAWMRSTFKNLLVDRLRRRRREEELKQGGMLMFSQMPGGGVASMAGTDEPTQDEYREAVARVLDELSPAELELLLDDGRTSPGLSPIDPREANLRRVRRHRLRQKLRGALEDFGFLNPKGGGA